MCFLDGQFTPELPRAGGRGLGSENSRHTVYLSAGAVLSSLVY